MIVLFLEMCIPLSMESFFLVDNTLFQMFSISVTRLVNLLHLFSLLIGPHGRARDVILNFIPFLRAAVLCK